MKPGEYVTSSDDFSEGRMEEKGELDHYIGLPPRIRVRTEWQNSKFRR